MTDVTRGTDRLLTGRAGPRRADLPAGHPGLGPVLDQLDESVAAAAGRLYLAKDARTTRPACARMYGPLDGWRSVRAKLDPAGVFQSDPGRRVGLCDTRS